MNNTKLKSEGKKRPNIVFILADDLGYGDLGCYGATKILTPNVDKIAQRGIKFTDAHSSSAVCTPSRYSVITGRYCWRTWLKEWVIHGHGKPLIEKERKTIADVFKQNGYATAAIGKWHLGLGWKLKEGAEMDKKGNEYDAVDYSKSITHGPNDLGFDYFFGIAGSLDMFPYVFIENDHVVGTPNKLKKTLYQQQRKGWTTGDWKDEEVDIRHTEKALEFMEKTHQEDPQKPFFLYFPTAAPHRPCDIQPEFVKGKSRAGDRGDMVVLFDWIVGQIDEKLKELRRAENTIFIVSSDNGARLACYNGKDYGHKSCGNLRGQKADIWDGGHREPFIVRWPGVIPEGIQSDQLICLSDLFATFSEMFGKSLPENAAEDSVSFFRAMKGKKMKGGRNQIVHHSGNGMFSFRKGNWKVIDGKGSGGFSRNISLKKAFRNFFGLSPEGQLYNLETDLKEECNLWGKRPDKVKELLELLRTVQNSKKSRNL